MYNILRITYANWKALKTKGTYAPYVITTSDKYTAVMVDTTKTLVFVTAINRVESNANLTDYTTNILGSSTTAVSIDDVIAAVLAT